MAIVLCEAVLLKSGLGGSEGFIEVFLENAVGKWELGVRPSSLDILWESYRANERFRAGVPPPGDRGALWVPLLGSKSSSSRT